MPRRLSKPLWRALIALSPLALLCLFACDLLESAKADKVLAASLLASPDYDFSEAVQPPADAGLPSIDAGFAKVPALTVAQVFFADRDPTNPKQAPTGVAGARVDLAFAGHTYALKDKGGGNYSLTTLEAPDFKYVEQAEYKLTVVSGGETYTATVTGPRAERIEQFHANPPAPIEIAANTPVQLTRSSTDNIAFTTVFPAGQSTGAPTYTDAPSTARDLLDLLIDDGKWRQKTITVPATAFKEADTFYVVNVSAVEKGSTSSNLFTASVLMVGIGDLGVVKTK